MANLPQSGVQLVAQGESQFFGTLNKGRSALGDFGDAAKKAGGGFNALGEIATGALRHIGTLAVNAGMEVARAIGKGLKDSIKSAGDFEQTLNVLGATSGATADELKAVGQRAKELGADMTLPATSAQDAAEVMLELSKAGMSVEESMNAAKGALQLSAAAQVDAATAASITAGALNAFELAATDAVRVADLLAAGANASSASMTDLSQGLQQAGFAFNAAGLPIEDLITSLAALTNVGLTGSDAGTALKNALMRLMDPTDKAAKLMDELNFSAYDANGQMKQLPDIIADLNKAFAGMTDEQRNAALGNIFLSDGMKAMIPLLDLNKEGFLALKDSVTQEGAAAEVANAQMQGWNGAMAAASSQIETLQLVIGQQLLPLLTPLGFAFATTVANITQLIERFVALIPEIQKSADPFNKFLAVLVVLNPSLAGVTSLLFRMRETIMPLIEGFTGLNSGAYGVANALSTVLGPLGATSSSVVTATVALFDIWGAIQRVATILTGQFTGAVGGAQQTTATLVNFFLGTMLPALATAATWFANNLPTAIAIAQAAFQEVSNFIFSVMPTVQSIITQTLAIIGALWEKHGTTILAITQSAWTMIKGVIQVVLGAIQGILAIVMAAITGDYTGAMESIKQANATIWNGIRTFLHGVLDAIAALFGTSLDGIIKTWITNFQKFAVIAGPFMKEAQSVIEGAINAITGAFGGITSAINSAIGAIKRFIDAAAKIVVPKLITPGSPTPLETGLVGIASAMDEVISRGASFGDALGGMLGSADTTAGAISDAVNDLMKGKDKNEDSEDILGFGSAPTAPVEIVVPDTPDFWSKIVTAGIAGGVPQLAPPAPAPPPTPAPTRDMSIQPVTNYNMPIYTNQSPTVLQHSLDVARALAR